MERTTLVGGLTDADRDHGSGLFDQAIDGQGGPAHKLVIFDLLIECILARQVSVSG